MPLQMYSFKIVKMWEDLPFATTWIDLESIILISQSGISQRKTTTTWFYLHMDSNKQTSKQHMGNHGQLSVGKYLVKS